MKLFVENLGGRKNRDMKINALLLGGIIGYMLVSCKDDDRDDTVFEVPSLTGKYWYSNRWKGDKDSYEKNDVLEVLKFERNGELVEVDFGGRNESVAGTWSNSRGNEIKLNYTAKESETWDVMHSGEDYISAIINDQGLREYTTDAGWLEDLTTDAFLVNEYTSSNRYETHIGGSLRGNMNIREANLIISSDQIVPMGNKGYFWSERKPVSGDYVTAPEMDKEIRFYVRIGKDGNLKLRDVIYGGQNIPDRPLADVQLKADNEQGISALTVEWNPYERGDVYYQVEVFSKDMDIMKPYFVSRVQVPGSRKLVIRPNTAGEINRMSELKPDEPYTVRLAAILFEPGADMVNDAYSYANWQAVTFISTPIIWK